MSILFKKWRKQSAKGNKVLNYLAYALGEVVLIIIGILLAVNINARIADRNNNVLRCQYLEELKFTFEYDIQDVEENIAAFERWEPKIKALTDAFETNKLRELDSLINKIEAAKGFIFFGQRSKTKIEELKYSSVNLIQDRNLKNRILLYQDSDVMFLRQIERRYNLVDEELRQYFSKTLFTGNMTIDELEKDVQFFSLMNQKRGENGRMLVLYENLLKEQYEINELLAQEIAKVCK